MINRFLHLVGCIAVGVFLITISCAANQGGGPPPAPTGLTVTQKGNTFSLTWTAVAGEKYNVYRSSDPTLPLANRIAVEPGATSTTTNDSGNGLKPGATYYWAVTAVNQNGESALSNIVQATVPQAPGPLTPTTNVGTTSSSNVQNPKIDLYGITTMPATLSTDSGSLTWSDSDTETLINNVCVLQRPKTEPTVNMPSFGTPSTYAVINVIRLSDPDSNAVQTVQSNNWYIYSQQKHWYRGWLHGWSLSDFDGSTRLYGAQNVIVIPIVLNDKASTVPKIQYKITVTKTQASNVAAVYSLLGTVFPAGKAVAGALGASHVQPNTWGCGVVPIAYQTSSVKADATLSTGGPTPSTSSITFTNESKQWWDVSFALPVTKVSALQYNSTNNTVTASQINKQSLFAVFDLYVPPTNLSATGYNLIPHPFAGVAMNSQPLHSLLFGGSIGLHLAEVYAGASFVKQQQLSGLSSGSSATSGQVASATSYSYKVGFSLGIKISVKTAISAFSNSKSK